MDIFGKQQAAPQGGGVINNVMGGVDTAKGISNLMQGVGQIKGLSNIGNAGAKIGVFFRW
jgi:hypothetical protein